MTMAASQPNRREVRKMISDQKRTWDDNRSREVTEALNAAAERVRQDDRRNYNTGMQDQQQSLHLLGELYGRRG